MVPRPLALTVRFRSRGWQWPVAHTDALRIVDAGSGELLAELPGSFLLALIANQLEHDALREMLAAFCRPLPELPAPPPERPRLPAAAGRRLRRPA